METLCCIPKTNIVLNANYNLITFLKVILLIILKSKNKSIVKSKFTRTSDTNLNVLNISYTS